MTKEWSHVPLSTTQLGQTLLPHSTQRYLNFQTIGNIFALRGVQFCKAAGQKLREDLSKVGIDLNPGLVKSLLFVLVQVYDGLFNLALVASYGLDHVLQRRLLLLDAVDHVHDLGVDLLLHSLEPFGNVAQRRFAFCNVLALEIVDCVRTPEVVLLVRNPFVLGFHMANRLSGNVLILFQFLKLMPELLHIQTVLGNPRVLGLHRLLKLPQLLVKASQFGPFVIELRLRNIMCILFPER